MRCLCASVFATLLVIPASKAGAGGVLYVTNGFLGGVGEYDVSTGATIRTNLISGLSEPTGVTVDGAGHLYVESFPEGAPNARIGDYNALTGAVINANMIPGLPGGSSAFIGLAMDGAGHLFVSGNKTSALGMTNTVGEYNAITGAAINTNFVTVPGGNAGAIALDGSGHLYVSYVSSQTGNFTIGEYNAATGAAINANLITLPGSGLGGFVTLRGIAVGGGKLYVAEGNFDTNTIGEYNATTGAAINANFITSGINDPLGLALNGNDLYVASFESGIGVFNASTGAIINSNLVPAIDGDSIYSLAIQPSAVPEPSGLVLCGVTAMAIGFGSVARRLRGGVLVSHRCLLHDASRARLGGLNVAAQ